MIGSKETLEISKRQLFKAVHNDDIEEVTRILGLGVNINVQDDLGRTPIFLAVLRNNLSMVEKLAKFGANLEVKDNLGYTILSKVMLKDSPVRKISQNERLNMIKTLIKYGAKPTTYSRGILPIHIAIKEGRSLNIVKVFLTEDTANARDIFGWTPLHIAVWDNRINVVELLIKYEHIDVNQKDNKGNTPLMLAAKKNFIDIEVLLLIHEANKNPQSIHRQTSFSEISQYENISSPGSSISRVSQYSTLAVLGSSQSTTSEVSQYENISSPWSNTHESTRSSIDSFSPSGSYAVDPKRRKLNHTLFSQ